MKIYFENRHVADLIPGDMGPSMVYTEYWRRLAGAFPVSIRMPVREEAYGPAEVLPWIVNLLPEEKNLEAVARITGVGKADALGILAEIGRDTAGALSFAERGVTKMTCKVVESEEDLERILDELPSKPFLTGEKGVSMSLAGVQTKLGVHVDDEGRICIPTDGAPSTWILKPDSPNLWGGVYNEAFCLRLARNIRLDTPEIKIGRAGKRKYLLVSRYDRQQEGENWRRLHQEDYCQALGVFPSMKYEHNGSGRHGPRLRDMIEITRKVADLPAVPNLMRYAIFNVLVCNTDSHAKNYSLLLTGGGVRLTPIYDVMCGAVWPQITRKLANSVATKRYGDYLKGRHWQREALLCGLSSPAVVKMVQLLCKLVDEALDRTVEEIAEKDQEGRGMAELCRDEIRKRVTFVKNGLKEQDANPMEWVTAHLGGAVEPEELDLGELEGGDQAAAK